MFNKHHAYNQYFLLPRLERALVKILAFLLFCQITYLLYIINSLNYQNNYFYISGNKNQYFSIQKTNQLKEINAIVTQNLIQKYILYFEGNKRKSFIKNLSSENIYQQFMNNNTTPISTTILQIHNISSNEASILIQQKSTINNQIHNTKYKILIKYNLTKNNSQYILKIHSYEKQKI